MTEPLFQNIADAAAHWATAVAVVIGGIWALYRFGLTRQREVALSMSLSCKCVPRGGNESVLAAMCATIKNTSMVKLEIRRAREPAYPRDSDDDEILKYGADLQLRRVDDTLTDSTPVRWFPDPKFGLPTAKSIELDLLSSYEQNGETSFWMEPGETYELGTAVVLPKGVYIALLTILGEASDRDFWRSEFILMIQESSETKDCVVTPHGPSVGSIPGK